MIRHTRVVNVVVKSAPININILALLGWVHAMMATLEDFVFPPDMVQYPNGFKGYWCGTEACLQYSHFTLVLRMSCLRVYSLDILTDTTGETVNKPRMVTLVWAAWLVQFIAMAICITIMTFQTEGLPLFSKMCSFFTSYQGGIDARPKPRPL